MLSGPNGRTFPISLSFAVTIVVSSLFAHLLGIFNFESQMRPADSRLYRKGLAVPREMVPPNLAFTKVREVKSPGIFAVDAHHGNLS